MLFELEAQTLIGVYRISYPVDFLYCVAHVDRTFGVAIPAARLAMS